MKRVNETAVIPIFRPIYPQVNKEPKVDDFSWISSAKVNLQVSEKHCMSLEGKLFRAEKEVKSLQKRRLHCKSGKVGRAKARSLRMLCDCFQSRIKDLKLKQTQAAADYEKVQKSYKYFVRKEVALRNKIISVFVKRVLSCKTVTLHISPLTTILEVKQLVAEKFFHANISCIILVFSGRFLKNYMTLSSCGVNHMSTLRLATI